ncbi:MAG: hypothetical protein AAF212_03845 [Verrucomicrobiota bacterium]
MKQQALFIFLAFVILLTAVGGAFGVVWARIETAQTAKDNAQLEREIARLQREEMHLSSVIADLERPENLKVLLAELGSDLGPVSSERMIRIGEDGDLPDLESVHVSTMHEDRASFQLSIQNAVSRPVFVRD